MQVSKSTVQYDYDFLDTIPCSVYFYNNKKMVEPKRIFTVTNKRIDWNKMTVEVYVMEIGKWIDYNSDAIRPVSQFFVN
jgi:hypothetical protein